MAMTLAGKGKESGTLVYQNGFMLWCVPENPLYSDLELITNKIGTIKRQTLA